MKEDRDYPNPERILDGAKAELELAVIYYNRSDYASSANHIVAFPPWRFWNFARIVIHAEQAAMKISRIL